MRTHSLLRLSSTALLGMCLIVMGSQLVGCDNDDGPAEKAGEKIDKAAEDAGDAIEDAGEKIDDAVDPDTDGGK